MRSVVLFSVLSFLLIFSATFLLTGVFGGIRRAIEQKENALPAPVVEDGTDLDRQSLRSRAEEIARRREELQGLEEAVALEKAVVGEELKKLGGAEAGIRATIGQIDESRRKSLRKLAKMYEAMPPKDAASILSGMELDIVGDILRGMQERAAAKVMAALDPARAAVLSDMLSAKVEAP